MLIVGKDKHLENNYNQLKENVTYGQQLAKIGSWTHDIKNDEIFLSDEVYHILGSNSQEFDGKLENYYQFIHPDDLYKVQTAIQKSLEGIEYDLEYRILTSEGTEKFVHERTKALFDENKNLLKIIGILQDITRQKVIETNLIELGDNLNQAQKVAKIGSWKYHIFENKLYFSEEMYHLYEIDPLTFNKEFDSILRLIHPDDQAKMRSAVEICLAGKSYQNEYRVPQPDGSEKYILSKGEPIFNNDHTVIGIMGVSQDITEKKLLEKELFSNYKNLNKAQSLAHIGSWEVDLLEYKSYWSEEACRIYGVDSDNYDKNPEAFFSFVHPDDLQLILNALKNPHDERNNNLEFRIVRKDGTIRYVHQLLEYVFDKDGKPIHLYGTTKDITDEKELQEKLLQSQETISMIQNRFKVLVQNSNDVFIVTNRSGTVEYISSAVEKILGFSTAEMTGNSVFNLVEGNEKLKLIKMFEESLNGLSTIEDNDIKIKTKTDNEIYIEVNINNLLSEPSILGIVINFRDITKRKEMESEIAYVATHDDLTKLPNRVYFNNEIKHYLKESNLTDYQFAVILLDIDEFKNMNHELGSEFADQFMIEISIRLREYLGYEIFICRYSWDQFAIIVNDSDSEEYESIAKKIIQLFSYSFKLELLEVFISISLGISIYPLDGKDVESLIKHASIALVRSKDQGKNRYRFHSPEMDLQNHKHFILRNDLRKAIERNQLKVYYQPEVNLETSEIIAAEALIRWEHPEWGLVPPNEFIHMAEETGFIIDIGKWLLREVCSTYKEWHNNGLPDIKISINYSSLQFYEKNLVENIKSIIDEFELKPNFIIVEIIESILINNFEQVISNIKKIQALGIKVALDDFGTGFSSLEYLNKFRIDIIKIDRSFIQNVTTDETSSIITKIVHSLAHELNVKLVAEGIESCEQLFYLQSLKCNFGQGYLYSRPVPKHEFEELLQNKECRPVVCEVFHIPTEERRKYFRARFPKLLEASATIIKINGRSTKLGNTKVVIKNMGPGGLCFVSNIRFPVNDMILLFHTELLGEEIKVYGRPVWIKEGQGNLYEYGIEFTYSEDEMIAISKILNQFQIKLKNNSGFNDGKFTTDSLISYFNQSN